MSNKINWERAEREMKKSLKELKMLRHYCDSINILLYQGADYQVQLTVTTDEGSWIESGLPGEG